MESDQPDFEIDPEKFATTVSLFSIAGCWLRDLTLGGTLLSIVRSNHLLDATPLRE